jgi:MFS superfamily sulfate permease-like transporter
MAIVISLLGFMEAISIAKAMAARTGQKLDPNRELIGQGLANMAGSFFSSYAVSGSFSRSAVNIQAGAVSGLSNVFSSCVVVITLIFLTPLLYHLPQAVLAAIIMMAVIGLVNVKGFIHAWKAQKYDGAIGIITFITTLVFAPHLDRGIMIGVGLSLLLYLLRGMKPKIVLLSLHPDGTFRNRMRFNLAQCQHVAVIRYSGSLFFASVNYLEEQILERISRMSKLRHILIVGNGINELDASGEDMLSILVSRIREAGYDISFSGLNDSVLDTLHRTHLYEKIGEDHFYRNAARAISSIHPIAHTGSDETVCPLKEVVYDAKSKANNNSISGDA